MPTLALITIMNMLQDSQLVLLGAIALGLLASLITLVRKAGGFGLLLLGTGGSVIALLLGAHFLHSGSHHTKVDVAQRRGNAAARVWVDTHTGIYYCPGAELYGRTSGGRYMMQDNAQGDLFSPASNRPCL